MWGRQTGPTTGEKFQVLVDTAFNNWKHGGMTIDWPLVSQVAVPRNDIQTLTITGGPTGGTFTISGVNPLTGDAFTTAAIAYNATAAAVVAALVAVLGAGTVQGSGGALPGTPVVLEFIGTMALMNVAAMTFASSLTGGTAPAGAFTTTQDGIAVMVVNNGINIAPGNRYLRYGQTMCEETSGPNAGYFGPYDPTATDGRQTLTRGRCFVLNETVIQNDPNGGFYNPVESDIVGGFDRGRVYWDRILNSGTAGHSLALGPTAAEFLAAFPGIEPIYS
jgi:hypothetical protein